MKNSIKLLPFLCVVVLFGCVPPVIFTEHQPKGFSEESHFMNHFQGVFYCEGDHSIVRIESNLITKEMLFKIGMTITELQDLEGVIYQDGEVYVEGYSTSFDAYIRNDSVFSDLILKDTIFELSREEHVVTEFNGHQVLNRKIDDGVWEVFILSLDKNHGIYLFEVFMPDDLSRLKRVTYVDEIHEGEELIISISPTVNEFNQILQDDLIFQACDHFIRIKQSVSI